MDYQKSDKTLKLQQLRMQLELLTYCRIKLKKNNLELIDKMDSFWQQQCKKDDIEPINDFRNEFNTFNKESLLKFAPKETLINMEVKAKKMIEKMGYDLLPYLKG